MNFEPTTKEQNAAAMLFPDGVYDFTVEKATDKTSQAGNEMIEAQLRVFGPDDREQIVFEYLMAKLPMQRTKLIEFCDATGLASKYNLGTLDAATIQGRNGKAELCTEPARNGYPPKNKVLQFIAANGAAPAARTSKARTNDEENPFNS